MSERAPVELTVLRWARETAGFSIDAAAERLNVPPERIIEWETGAKSPTIGQLRVMADRFRLSFGVFLRLEPPTHQIVPPRDFRRIQRAQSTGRSPSLTAQLRAGG